MLCGRRGRNTLHTSSLFTRNAYRSRRPAPWGTSVRLSVSSTPGSRLSITRPEEAPLRGRQPPPRPAPHTGTGVRTAQCGPAPGGRGSYGQRPGRPSPRSGALGRASHPAGHEGLEGAGDRSSGGAGAERADGVDCAQRLSTCRPGQCHQSPPHGVLNHKGPGPATSPPPHRPRAQAQGGRGRRERQEGVPRTQGEPFCTLPGRCIPVLSSSRVSCQLDSVPLAPPLPAFALTGADAFGPEEP